MIKVKNISRLLRIFWSYQKRKEKCSYLPSRLWIEPTAICNLNCKMCLNSSIPRGKKGRMDLNFFKRMIHEVSSYAYDVNLFHRAEPLTHPDIFKMIKYCKEKGLLTRLHTNGTLLTEKKSYELLESDLDLVSFSFDGFDKETYESIRVNADFDKTLNNILTFLNIKKKLQKKKPFTIVQTIRFQNDTLKPDLEDNFKNKFENLPLDKFTVRDAHNWGGNMELESGYQSIPKGATYAPCTFPWYALTIFWDGCVVPCPQDFFGEYCIGNVKDSTIAELWNNEKMIVLRKKMKKGDYKDLSPCNTCDRIWRERIFGIPKDYLRSFLSDNLFSSKFKEK